MRANRAQWRRAWLRRRQHIDPASEKVLKDLLGGTTYYTWDRSAGIKAPAAKPRVGDSEFRIEGARFAVAIETALPEEFSGATPDDRLKGFLPMLEAKAKLVFEDLSPAKASYTPRTGVTISRVFNGDAVIDGDRVDPQRWPMLQSPWVNQPSHEAGLSITDGKRTRVDDFKNWQVTEV